MVDRLIVDGIGQKRNRKAVDKWRNEQERGAEDVEARQSGRDLESSHIKKVEGGDRNK